LKLIFPIRRFVKQYSVKPDPAKFDIMLGVHLRHQKYLRQRHLEKSMDEKVCRWVKSFIENQETTETCAVLVGTEDEVSFKRMADCVNTTACSFLEIIPDDSARRRTINDKGDIGILMAVRVMHALSVLSTHLFTTAESSFSKLIAERWVANKGVSATLGKWWIMPIIQNDVDIFRPHEANYEGWEKGHSKKECEA